MRMIVPVYVYFVNKYIEFADTFFMVARKKNNQVHHVFRLLTLSMHVHRRILISEPN